MMAGIDFSAGEVFVSLDADLQNDPADIPALLSKLDEGYDVVSGWRKYSARCPRETNAGEPGCESADLLDLRRPTQRLRLHAQGVPTRGHQGRASSTARCTASFRSTRSWHGARVTEIPVQHHPRTQGQSKYGLERVVKVVLDLIVVKFLDRTSSSRSTSSAAPGSYRCVRRFFTLVVMTLTQVCSTASR